MATRFLKQLPGIDTVELERGVHGVYRVVEARNYGDMYCLVYRGLAPEIGSPQALEVVATGDVMGSLGLLHGFARPPEWAFVAPAYPSEVYEPLAFCEEGMSGTWAVDFCGTLKMSVAPPVSRPTVFAGAVSGESFKDALRVANDLPMEELAVPPLLPHDGALLSDYFDEETVAAKRKALDNLVPPVP